MRKMCKRNMRENADTRKKYRYENVSCARAAFMCIWHVLPRGALASSRYSCARRIECHVVLRGLDYLFSALFPPPERASRHLFMCARAQKPERFSHILTALHTLHVTYFALYITQVSSFCEGGCMLLSECSRSYSVSLSCY